MTTSLKDRTPKDVPLGEKLTLSLLIGSLSMFMAEVFAGSSQVWFVDVWSLMVVFPLYLAHSLFFLNLAFKTGKTSIPQLYLWGVLFGLYESWVTAVLWSGYPTNPGPMFGDNGVVAIGEFCTLVLFWHPILAFIMPILVFESFSISAHPDKPLNEIIIPSHIPYLSKDSKFKYLFFYVIVLGAIFQSLASGFNVLNVFIAIGGSILLIYLLALLNHLLTRRAKKKNYERFSIYSLKLGKTGFIIVLVYLILLYVIMFFLMMGIGRVPYTFPPYLFIISFYIFITVMLYKSKSIDDSDIKIPDGIFSKKDFFILYGILLGMAITICFLPLVVGFILLYILILSTIIIGIIIFYLFLKKALKGAVI